MKSRGTASRWKQRISARPCALGGVAIILFGPTVGLARGAATRTQQAPAPAATAEQQVAAIPPEQLDSLVAPIALYPDSLLTQTLVASTYPLEIIQLQQWLEKNPGLEGDALQDAVAQQPWDPSIQSMAVVPDLVGRLAADIQWTAELGNAFLAQQADVMAAVQRMRGKAQDQGALESNEQQVVEVQVVEKETIIVIEPTSPEVIYVPTYSPTVVYGPPVYPYPPIYYPPYTPGAAFVSFSVGFIWGAAIGGPCCRYGWGNNNVNININNNFNRSGNRSGGNWSHNPAHRGGTPYSDRATADRFGGTARGDSMSSRQTAARQQGSRQAGGGRAGSVGSGARGGSPSAGSLGRGSGAAGGGERVGNRSVPSSSRASGGFGGGSSSFSGSKARASSARGASSMGGRRGGRSGGGGRRR